MNQRASGGQEPANKLTANERGAQLANERPSPVNKTYQHSLNNTGEVSSSYNVLAKGCSVCLWHKCEQTWQPLPHLGYNIWCPGCGKGTSQLFPGSGLNFPWRREVFSISFAGLLTERMGRSCCFRESQENVKHKFKVLWRQPPLSYPPDMGGLVERASYGPVHAH